jgi:hypothetical protein
MPGTEASGRERPSAGKPPPLLCARQKWRGVQSRSDKVGMQLQFDLDRMFEFGVLNLYGRCAFLVRPNAIESLSEIYLSVCGDETVELRLRCSLVVATSARLPRSHRIPRSPESLDALESLPAPWVPPAPPFCSVLFLNEFGPVPTSVKRPSRPWWDPAPPSDPRSATT